jgi:hypothetical protein
MEKSMPKSNPTKQVSFRLPLDEYDELLQNANNENKTVSELARNRIASTNRTASLQDELRQLEARLVRKFFVMSCAIANLDRIEAKAANVRYNQLLREREH